MSKPGENGPDRVGRDVALLERGEGVDKRNCVSGFVHSAVFRRKRDVAEDEHIMRVNKGASHFRNADVACGLNPVCVEHKACELHSAAEDERDIEDSKNDSE